MELSIIPILYSYVSLTFTNLYNLPAYHMFPTTSVQYTIAPQLLHFLPNKTVVGDREQPNMKCISIELAEAAESSMRQVTLYQRPRQESDLSELLDAADYIDDDVVDSASDPLDGEEVRTIAGRYIATSGSNASSGESEEGVVRLVSPIATTMQSPPATPGRAILDESPAARINRHRKASRASSEASETVSIK